MSTDTFRGRLGDQTYADPALFALNVKAAAKAGRSAYLGEKDGYMPMKLQPLASGRLEDRGRTRAQMTIPTPAEREWLRVYVKTLDGRRGQVWAIHPMRDYLWVVIDGEAFALHKSACAGIRGAEAEPLDVTA